MARSAIDVSGALHTRRGTETVTKVSHSRVRNTSGGQVEFVWKRLVL